MKYAFCGGKLLDGTREMQPREGLVLRTDGDRITDIVPEGTDLTGYEVVNLKGGYLMPGLINMHVHLAGSGKPQKKQRDNEKLVKTDPEGGLRHGGGLCQGGAVLRRHHHPHGGRSGGLRYPAAGRYSGRTEGGTPHPGGQ